MGKRYYCDYCERSFIDDFQSRKKHIYSVNHARNRKLHYALSRDLATLLEEERKKDQCKKFRNQGYCPYEESCTFTHYSKEELAAFSLEVKNNCKAKVLENKLPSIENWLQKRQKSESVCKNPEIVERNSLQEYNCAMLPLSLQPVTITSIWNASFQTWG